MGNSSSDLYETQGEDDNDIIDIIDINHPNGTKRSTKTSRRDLVRCIHDKQWKPTIEILKVNLASTQEELSHNEIHILWNDGTLEVIRTLLKIFPDIHKERSLHGRNLVENKLFNKQWDFLRAFIRDFPYVVSEHSVAYACICDPPLDVLELILDQH